jgi:hypothetical protein
MCLSPSKTPRRGVPRAYNRRVARGWESKSVELQQDDAKSTGEPKRSLTPEQRQIESHREGLRLSRSRILAQLQAATNPHYRTILEQELAAVDEQITQLV